MLKFLLRFELLYKYIQLLSWTAINKVHAPAPRSASSHANETRPRFPWPESKPHPPVDGGGPNSLL